MFKMLRGLRSGSNLLLLELRHEEPSTGSHAISNGKALHQVDDPRYLGSVIPGMISGANDTDGKPAVPNEDLGVLVLDWILARHR